MKSLNESPSVCNKNQFPKFNFWIGYGSYRIHFFAKEKYAILYVFISVPWVKCNRIYLNVYLNDSKWSSQWFNKLIETEFSSMRFCKFWCQAYALKFIHRGIYIDRNLFKSKNMNQICYYSNKCLLKSVHCHL